MCQENGTGRTLRGTSPSLAIGEKRVQRVAAALSAESHFCARKWQTGQLPSLSEHVAGDMWAAAGLPARRPSASVAPWLPQPQSLWAFQVARIP